MRIFDQTLLNGADILAEIMVINFGSTNHMLRKNSWAFVERLTFIFFIILLLIVAVISFTLSYLENQKWAEEKTANVRSKRVLHEIWWSTDYSTVHTSKFVDDAIHGRVCCFCDILSMSERNANRMRIWIRSDLFRPSHRWC